MSACAGVDYSTAAYVRKDAVTEEDGMNPEPALDFRSCLTSEKRLEPAVVHWARFRRPDPT